MDPRRRLDITKVVAREILDSRGNPTVEVDVSTNSGFGRAGVPSGASTGSHEAVELRDGDRRRFNGRGVRKAVGNVNRLIAPRLIGLGSAKQSELDKMMLDMDGTSNKRRLGANAILGVSMAVARAAAASKGVPLFDHIGRRRAHRLPVPMMNVLNGGMHAGNQLTVQEFMVEAVGAGSCSEAVRMSDEVYQSLKSVLREEFGVMAVNVGDEGGFAPPMKRTDQALASLRRAISLSGHSEGDVRVGIDAAATTFYDRKRRTYAIDGRSLSAGRLLDWYASLVDAYGLLTIEDPFEEEAFDDFAELTRSVGKHVKVVGDDLYATNLGRLRRGIREGSTNAILVKLNQIGTLTETIQVADAASEAAWTTVISHRSGETEDPFISHLAVAVSSDFIKAGAPARGERTAKYNELLRIEESLGARARFAGSKFRL